MSINERAPLGYRIKNVTLIEDQETGLLQVKKQKGAHLERNGEGKILFPSFDAALYFCLQHFLLWQVIEPFYD